MFGLVAHGDQVGSVKGFKKATALQAQRQYILNLALSAALTDPPPGDRKIFNRGSVEVVLVLLTSCSATAAGQPRSKHQAVSPDTDGVCDVWSWMSLRTRRHLPTRSRSLNQHHRWAMATRALRPASLYGPFSSTLPRAHRIRSDPPQAHTGRCCNSDTRSRSSSALLPLNRQQASGCFLSRLSGSSHVLSLTALATDESCEQPAAEESRMQCFLSS